MPFTFAHPAAVLPLRRFAPRWLSFPALLVGTGTPDLAYMLANKQIDEIAHHWTGIFLFSLPVGVAVVWLLHRFGRVVIPAVPAPFRQVLAPLIEQPLGPILSVVCSVVIGAATHVFWDSFTHKDGWLVQQIAILHQPLALPIQRTARVCHLLWYLSTFVGLTWLALAYQEWREAARGNTGIQSNVMKWANALGLATVMLPIALAHHLFQESFFVALSSGLLIAVFVWRVETRIPQPRDKQLLALPR